MKVKLQDTHVCAYLCVSNEELHESFGFSTAYNDQNAFQHSTLSGNREMKYFGRNNVISNFNTLFYNTFLLIIQEHDSGNKEKNIFLPHLLFLLISNLKLQILTLT